MRRTALAVMIAIAVAMIGCFHPIQARNNVMQSWVGHSTADLIATWGPPSELFQDGSGGTVVVWIYQRNGVTTPASSTTTTTGNTSQTVYQPSQSYGWTAYRMFWVDGKGVVYRWAWKGL